MPPKDYFEAADIGTAEAFRQVIKAKNNDMLARNEQGESVRTYFYKKQTQQTRLVKAAESYFVPKYNAVQWLQHIARYPNTYLLYNGAKGDPSGVEDSALYLRALEDTRERFGLPKFDGLMIVATILNYYHRVLIQSCSIFDAVFETNGDEPLMLIRTGTVQHDLFETLSTETQLSLQSRKLFEI